MNIKGGLNKRRKEKEKSKDEKAHKGTDGMRGTMEERTDGKTDWSRQDKWRNEGKANSPAGSTPKIILDQTTCVVKLCSWN